MGNFDQELTVALDEIDLYRGLLKGPLWERLSRELKNTFTSEDILAIVKNYIQLCECRQIIPPAITTEDLRILVRKIFNHRGVPAEKEIYQIVQEAVDRIPTGIFLEKPTVEKVKELFEGEAKTPPVKAVSQAIEKKLKGGTRGELADKVGISKAELSKIERGRRAGSVDTLKKLGIPLAAIPRQEKLVGDKDTINKKPLPTLPKK